MSVDKRTLRQGLRKQRKGMPASAVVAAGEAVRAQLRGLPAFRRAASVISYVADENEVPTDLVLGEAARAGLTLYLPRSTEGVGVAEWRPGEPLIVGRGGVREPLGPAAVGVEKPAIALIPVVAWDLSGTRLGRGGGFYDRLFAALDPEIVRVGLAFEFQECSKLPRDTWDLSLHYVITERRIVMCGRRLIDQEASFQKGGLPL